jgi:hypothetical protein
MQHWLFATFAGVGLGLTLYACVRLRMYVGPLIRERFGDWARRAYWLVTILVMIIIGNAGLFVLRIYLDSQSVEHGTLILELWFGVIAMAVGLALVFRRMSRNA